MSTRKRHRDGAGWGPNGWIKHELIKRVMGGQTTVLRMKYGDGGVIIDMHAGTGEGIEIARGQPDLFRPNVSDATPALALRFAAESREPGRTSVILCESRFERRETLRRLYGHQAKILASNAQLARVDLTRFSWAVVLNDPSGPSDHAVEVMEHISRSIRPSDFIINLNEGALGRLAGVQPQGDDQGSNARLVAAVRQKAGSYAWMLDPENWRARLGKQFAYAARTTVNHKAMRGRVILVANYVTDGVKRMFDPRGELT